MQKIKILVSLSVVLLVLLVAFKVDGNPSDSLCLKKSYKLYKQNFMTKDGRIIDYERNGITTSEGQSYMLLRSLVMDDKVTFGLVYKWSKDNIQRKDKLFSWLWGKDKNGQYKVLDNNSASDADIDIAFALLLAYEKWGEYQYLEEAKPIINSIWLLETKLIGEQVVLMPGAQQAQDEKIKINPSYFSPFAFKMFQKYDELHDWNMLVNSSYYYLNEVSNTTKTGLPPNWFLIKDGKIVLENSPESDFSYDAIRVFPRVYLDYINTSEKRAVPVMEKSMFFTQKWKDSKTFYTNYQENGQLRDTTHFVGSRAVLIPVISIFNRRIAAKMYDSQVRPYLQKESYWDGHTDYYGKNLSWFAEFVLEKHLNSALSSGECDWGYEESLED